MGQSNPLKKVCDIGVIVHGKQKHCSSNNVILFSKLLRMKEGKINQSSHNGNSWSPISYKKVSIHLTERMIENEANVKHDIIPAWKPFTPVPSSVFTANRPLGVYRITDGGSKG
jgi:hypothetical protein